MATTNILVNNLCSWPLYFNRATGQGSVEIPPNAKGFPLLSHDEVLAQIQLGNRMFTGTDGMGSHARVQILDEAQRRELFGLEGVDTGGPVLVTQESVRELLAIRTKTKFHDRLQTMVKTDAEKKMLVELAFQAGAEESEAWKLDALRDMAKTAGV